MRSFIHLAFAAVVRHSATVPTHITNTRSAEVVDAEIAALTETLAERNEGRVLYERDTDDKLAGAKSYSIDAIESPAQLNYFHAFISATGSFILHAISLASLATGCCGVGNAEEGWVPLQKEADSDGLTLSHHEYMEWILRLAGTNGSHVGYHQREGSMFETLVFGFNQDGVDYHLSISKDENGKVRHSISFAHNSHVLEKRQGYLGVHINGGLEIEACQRKRGKDLACLLTPSELGKSNYIQGDVMDKSGDVTITYSLATFRSGRQKTIGNKPVCSNKYFYFSQSCIN